MKLPNRWLAKDLAPNAEVICAIDAMIMQYKAEQLELRIAELTTERDEYDKRRKEAMEKCEEWRERCHELEGKLKK